MSDYSIVPNAALTATADAIRTKSGSQATIEFDNNTGFKDAVDAIPTGGSGEWTTDGIANKSDPNGAITISNAVSTIASRAFQSCTGITEVTIAGNPFIGTYAFEGCSNMTKLHVPNLTKLKTGNYGTTSYTFQNCIKLEGVVFPSFENEKVDSYVFKGCTLLTYADFANMSTLGGANVFDGTALNLLILRKTSGIVALQGTNVFGDCPFKNGGAGGTIYIPKVLYDHLDDGTANDYQSATNWSTVYGYGTITWAKIEGSQYENYYADGTPIQTT